MSALTDKIATYPTANPHNLKVGDLLVSRKRWTLDQVYRVSPEFITTRPRVMSCVAPYASILCKFSKHAGRIDEDDYCVVSLEDAVQLVQDLRQWTRKAKQGARL